MQPQTEPERILPPVRAIATIVTTLTAAFVAAIIFTHLAYSEPRPEPPPRHVILPGAFSTDTHPPGGAFRSYADTDTIGLY